jgi:hypothetical protein
MQKNQQGLVDGVETSSVHVPKCIKYLYEVWPDDRPGNLKKAHYVRKPHPRCARMKNGDVQIACLCCHVLHYKVIGDTWESVSPIMTH